MTDEPHKERILVVEDEDIVRRIAVKALEKRGYTILQARNGEEAISLMAGITEPLDLLLTDVVMPGMNGLTMARQIVEKQPGLPVLYMSGYAEDIIMDRGVVQPGITFIEKWFTPETLCQKVREVLDAAKKTTSHPEL